MGIIENCLIFKKAWGSRAHDKTMIKFVSETKICRNRYHVIRVLWLWHLYLRTAISPEFWLHGSGNTHRKHKCHLAPKDFSVHEMRLQQFIRSFMQCVCVLCVWCMCVCYVYVSVQMCLCVCLCMWMSKHNLEYHCLEAILFLLVTGTLFDPELVN